jgi:hypothetical protein
VFGGLSGRGLGCGDVPVGHRSSRPRASVGSPHLGITRTMVRGRSRPRPNGG